MDSLGGAPLRMRLDAQTRIETIDPALAAGLGHDPAELVGAPVSSLLDADEIAGFGADLVALVQGDRQDATAARTLRSADGAPVPATLTSQARTSAGVFGGFTVSVTTEEPLAPLDALPAHFRQLTTATALVTNDGTILDTNDGWKALFADAIADSTSTIGQLVDIDDRPSLDERLEALRRGAASAVRMELRCVAGTGPFWCQLSLATFDGNPDQLTVSAEDISNQHLTNRVLLANESLFRSLAESSPVGLARLAPDLTITYTSPRWREMTGEGPDAPHPDMASLLHPAGSDDALDELRQRMDDGIPTPVVAQLAQTAAGIEWVSLRVGSVSDDELGLVGHVVTMEDVTQLVSVNESQSELAGIVESTSDLVGIADLRTGELVYLNAAAAERFAPDGLDGLTVADLYGPEGVRRYQDEVYPVLRRGDTWTGEFDMRKADGTVIRVLQTVAAEVGDSGEPERASSLGRDVSNERKALDELAYQATHDALTGLPNRSLLIDHLELALARSARDRRPVGVLFVDLDRFKIVNDTHGHDTGDKLLRALADRMATVLRPSDTVARLGGDEFVVLCEDIDGEIDALAIAERIRSAIDSAPVRINGHELEVGASIGIAISNGNRDADSLLQRADAAMYRAKHAGRGRTELFDDVRRDRARRRNERADELAQAIEDDALDVHYQPLVDLRSGQVVAIEALVRWQHPTHGLFGPSEFLSLAGEIDLIGDLDALVVAKATRDAARWRDQLGASAPALHVNVDGSTLLSGQLGEIVDTALLASKLPAGQLRVEFSEAFLMANGETTLRALSQITGKGVRLAVDDVGLGATRLPRLGSFDADLLKIDGSLTNDLAGEQGQRLIRSVVGLASALGIGVGAEAVEQAEAVPTLRRLGVQVAQGHIFAAALPADELEPLLTLRSNIARSD